MRGLAIAHQQAHGRRHRQSTGATLEPAERFNHYPATPLCTLTWWFEGTGDTLEPGAVTHLATGFAPEELRRPIAEDEGFWAYRVWQ